MRSKIMDMPFDDQVRYAREHILERLSLASTKKTSRHPAKNIFCNRRFLYEAVTQAVAALHAETRAVAMRTYDVLRTIGLWGGDDE